jgi:hypothetical protein
MKLTIPCVLVLFLILGTSMCLKPFRSLNIYKRVKSTSNSKVKGDPAGFPTSVNLQTYRDNFANSKIVHEYQSIPMQNAAGQNLKRIHVQSSRPNTWWGQKNGIENDKDDYPKLRMKAFHWYDNDADRTYSNINKKAGERAETSDNRKSFYGGESMVLPAKAVDSQGNLNLMISPKKTFGLRRQEHLGAVFNANKEEHQPSLRFSYEGDHVPETSAVVPVI